MKMNLLIVGGLMALTACTTTVEPFADLPATPNRITVAPAGDLTLAYPALVSVPLSRSESMAGAILTATTTEPILPQLTGHGAKDRARVKAREIAKLDTRGQFAAAQYGNVIELGQAEEIVGGVQVLARAWRDGVPIGFGRDGSVEWERFRIYNPPIMVPDGSTHTEVGYSDGRTYQVHNYKEDPVAALRAVIAHNVKLVGKPGANVVAGKVGNTTSTFYPDANVETTSVDGPVYYNSAAAWATAHDAADGTGSDASGVNGYTAGTFTTVYHLYRLFILFDSSAIPDGDTVSDVTLSLVANTVTNGDNDGDDFIAIVTSTPAINTDLSTADFDQMGTTEQHAAGQRKDITGISTGVYTDWTLDANGRGNTSKTSITKFGAREGHDLLNSAPVGTSEVNFKTADTAGTTEDPKLVVTHAVAATSTIDSLLIAGD